MTVEIKPHLKDPIKTPSYQEPPEGAKPLVCILQRAPPQAFICISRSICSKSFFNVRWAEVFKLR